MIFFFGHSLTCRQPPTSLGPCWSPQGVFWSGPSPWWVTFAFALWPLDTMSKKRNFHFSVFFLPKKSMIDFFHLISGVHRHHHVQPTMERRHVHNEFLVSLQTLQIKDFLLKKCLTQSWGWVKKKPFFRAVSCCSRLGKSTSPPSPACPSPWSKISLLFIFKV